MINVKWYKLKVQCLSLVFIALFAGLSATLTFAVSPETGAASARLASTAEPGASAAIPAEAEHS